MALSRRRLFQYVALTGGCRNAGQAAQAPVGLDMLHHVTAAHGTNLSYDRLRVIQPVVEQRLSELRAIRDLEIADGVTPTLGILRK